MSTCYIDTKALDNAADTFSRSMRALNSMELADLPPELDQDARDIARIIQDHGKGYEGTEYDDMTAPLLESLARLVQAAKAADRLAALEEQLHLANIDALQTEAERNELASELRQAMDERDAAQAEVRELRAELARVREEARKEVEQLAASEKTCRRIANEKTLEAMELRQQLAAAQAEARNWKRIAEDATHVEREELSRVREIVSGMREYADSCDHPSEASKRNAVEYWLTQLEDALSQAAEPEFPPASAVVDDRCGECGEPEPECACDERESLPLISQATYERLWLSEDHACELREGSHLVVNRVSYRIADTDEHGLPVVERNAGMPEEAIYYVAGEYFSALPSRAVRDRNQCFRIEDFHEHAQRGQEG